MVRNILILRLLPLILAGCASAVRPVALEACGQSLDRSDLIRIVASRLQIDVSTGKYIFYVSRKDCDYFVTVYLKNGPPDSETFLVIGGDGEIKDVR